MPEENTSPEKIGELDLRKIKDMPLPPLEGQPLRPERVSNDAEQIKVKVEQVTEQLEKEGNSGPEGQPGSIIHTDISRQKLKEQEKAIEKILERDLEGIFLKMSPAKRQEFALAGETTARSINELFAQGKATAAKIIGLIKKWLSLIPGVNVFFLEQEAKIKADEVFKQKNQQK